MENQDEELHLKQSFLKSEIIDKNIDQDKFLDYCMKVKENGDDINSWTFDELKRCVEDFNEILKKESEQGKEKEKIKEFASLNSFLSSTNTVSNPVIQPQVQPQQQSTNQSQFNLKNVSNIIQNNLYNSYNSSYLLLVPLAFSTGYLASF